MGRTLSPGERRSFGGRLGRVDRDDYRTVYRDGYLYVVRLVLTQKEKCHDIYFAGLALVVGLLDSQYSS